MTSLPRGGYGGSLEGGYSIMPPFPFGGGGGGGIGSLLQPHVQQLKEQYNPRKVDKYMQRVERITERMLPGATFGGGGIMPMPYPGGGGDIIREPYPSLPVGIPENPFLDEEGLGGSLDLLQGIGGLGPLIR